ncbi:MAG: manganese efflux pump MntP family protein [Bacilli bacterium]
MGYSIILAISLAMDAFTTSVTLGLSSTVTSKYDRFKVAISFGFFQFLMPLIGGTLILPFVKKYSLVINILGTLFLMLLGCKMIYDSFSNAPNQCENIVCDGTCNNKICKRTGKSRVLSNRLLLKFSIATSIDALCAGLIIKSLNIDFLYTIILIGLITFILSLLGVNSGSLVKRGFEKKFELLGGVILILLAIKSFI